MTKKFFKKGFSLIEVVVAVAIISSAFLTLMLVAIISVKLLHQSSNNLKAGMLLEEGVEAVKIMRDDSWDDNIAVLNNGTNYFLNFNAGAWSASLPNVYIDNFFERKIILSEVKRDANDDINNLGVVDIGTRKLEVYVSWPGSSGTTTRSVSTYITDLF